ncbi:integral membrane protein [Talaromyces pinophilus]|uniref:Integral membrane protein n=1 Tax=Talaromyces pinophilus TaxID=128442 RepID=A0A6V8H109_TALPI|nr:integral membrane protein [Talaromyces pinophilus]
MDDNGHSEAILAVSITLLAISLLSVGLRCFVRTCVLHAFGWDDFFMVIAMILYLGFSTCGILGANFGIGQRLAYFEFNPNHLRRALLCWWIGEIFYVITCIMLKISIILTLLRLAIERIHLWILPVDYFWNKGATTERGTCIDTDILIIIGYVYSAGAAVTDLTIVIIPVALIWNLRMNRLNKSVVLVILCIGSIASVAVIVRIPFIHHYKDREFLYNTYEIGICSYVEAGLGITAASLATLRPLGRLLRDGNPFSRCQYHSNDLSPLSRGRPHESRSFTSKNKTHEDEYRLWGGGSGIGSHRDMITVALGDIPTLSEEVLPAENTSTRSEV